MQIELDLEELEILREGLRRLQFERNVGHEHIKKTADLNKLLKKILYSISECNGMDELCVGAAAEGRRLREYKYNTTMAHENTFTREDKK